MPVYIAKAGETNRVKIGHTKGVVYNRLRQLQTGCPERINPVIIFPTGNRDFERELHQQFKASRVTGEWFEYHPDVSAFVAKRYAQRRKLAELEERCQEEAEERAYDLRMEKEQEAYESAQQEAYEKQEYQKWLLSQEEEE